MHDETLLALLFDQTSDGVYLVDKTRCITAWNTAAERITGYSRDKMVGQFCHANLLMHSDDRGRQLCKEGCPLLDVLQDGQPRETNVYLHHASGHRVPVSVRVFPIQEDGKITGAMEIFNANTTQVEDRVRLVELERSAMYDELTGIANRRMGQMRLNLAYEELRQHGTPYCVLLADIDHFKKFNDRYGHKVGDEVLRMVARSLSSGLRAYDTLARWGGEEFLVILAQAAPPALQLVAERLRMLVESSVIFPEGQERKLENGIRVTVSLGGAVAQPGEEVTALVERADINLYASKSGGRNRVTIG